jgi:hypothetical protein
VHGLQRTTGRQHMILLGPLRRFSLSLTFIENRYPLCGITL